MKTAKEEKNSVLLKLKSKTKKLARSDNQSNSELIKGFDHSNELNRLSRVRGQIDGISTMIKGRRYCPEIIQQIKATRAALRSIECLILENHLNHCVKEAVSTNDIVLAQKKIDEIIQLIRNQTH